MRTIAAAGVAALLALGAVGVAGAESPTTDPTTAAAYGSGWIASQVSGGALPGPSADPSVGQSVVGALSLAATATDEATFRALVAYAEANIETYIDPYGTDQPGAIGYALLLAAAAGEDPHDFGGVDLVARLGATLDAYEAGLFGADDPTYDGAYRQALAILGLEANGAAVPAAAVQWLVDQQCGAGSDAASVGGWQAYRADTATPCGPPDPDLFSGPDSNSTALAAQALVAASTAPSIDPLEALARWQEPDGGWDYILGSGVDPNSTALVIQAIVAEGEDPASADWMAVDGGPYDSLLSFQIGCDGAEADRGAFASPYSDGLPDQFATIQAVWGAAGKAFPYGEVTEWGSAPVPCQPATTTTTAPATTTTTAAVAAVAVTPRFTG